MTSNSNSFPRERLDCIFPYVRDKFKARYKPNTIKFTYEQEKISTRTETTKDEKGNLTTKVITITETKEQKATLKVFKQSNEEDIEHFFEAFETMQRELQETWDETKTAKDRDATTLFKAMEKMLDGEALVGWHDVLAKWDANVITSADRSWESFKTTVCNFILTKLCPPEAFETQRRCMMERWMPDGMDVADYYK